MMKNIGGGVENPDCPPIELDYNIAVDNRECQTFVFEKVGTYRNDKEPWMDGSSIGKVHEYTIPENAEQIRIEVWGAGGGHNIADHYQTTFKYNSIGGKGGYSYGTLQIAGVNLEKAYGIKNRKLYLYVGEKGHNAEDIIKGEYDEDGILIEAYDGRGGWNGGGSGQSKSNTYGVQIPGEKKDVKMVWEGGGGGASDVRTANGTWNQNLNKRIIVAGGGGGTSRANNTEVREDGGDGAGGLPSSTNLGFEDSKSYQVYGQKGYTRETKYFRALGGGMRLVSRGNSTSCTIPGGGPLKGGGGYYAGGTTSCGAKSSKTCLLEMCHTAKNVKDYTCFTECGGGGGGSSYISKIFTNPGGQSGVRRTNGKIRICVVSKGGTVNHKMKFPQAKYGELSFADSICPYNIVNASTHIASISDYYTLSTFREADGTIIDNRPAIRCGTAGQWETNTDGSIKMIYECKELPKCKQPFAVDNNIDWGDYDFEVTNTAIVHDIDGNNRMQCMVDKSGNAYWYKVK